MIKSQNKKYNYRRMFNRINEFSLFIAMIILIIAFYLIEPRFLSQRNIYNIILQVSILAPISIGMTLVVLTGGIDLSVGSILAFSQAIAAGLLLSGQNILFSCLVSIVIGALLGMINGLTISFLQLPPLIATLGMMSIARGLQMTYTLGSTLYSFPESFRYLGTAYWLGIPAPIYLTFVIFFVFHFIMKYSIIGRSIYAIGGNPEAAIISGISLNKVRIWVYTACGVLTSFAAILQLMRVNAHEASAGLGIELDVIACVVIGGTSLAGGRGSILKTALGTLVYGVIINGLNIIGVNPFIQKTVIGALIIFAASLDTNLQRFIQRKKRIQTKEGSVDFKKEKTDS